MLGINVPIVNQLSFLHPCGFGTKTRTQLGGIVWMKLKWSNRIGLQVRNLV
jgi:hypothetical protein